MAFWHVLHLIELEFENFDFWGGGEPENLEKNLSEQIKEPKPHMAASSESKPGHSGGRLVQSPLRHSCSPAMLSCRAYELKQRPIFSVTKRSFVSQLSSNSLQPLFQSLSVWVKSLLCTSVVIHNYVHHFSFIIVYISFIHNYVHHFSFTISFITNYHKKSFGLRLLMKKRLR